MACITSFNRVILFSSNVGVISLCRHALEPAYSIEIVNEIGVSLALFPCVILIDAAAGEYAFDEVSKKISSHIPPLFLVSLSTQHQIDSFFQKYCIPFPCDLDLLRHLVEQRMALLTDIKLLPDRNRIQGISNVDVPGFEELVGKSKEIVSVKRQLEVVSSKDLTILLLGESGTGKSLAAGLIHKYSYRRNNNYVQVDMATIPEGLAESELFGSVPGAYTGAVKRSGRFAKADGGTLFMDEIAETSVSIQAKLLGILETGSFCSVGSDTEHHIDVRFICATNADLLFLSKKGKFREDLYYRIADYTIIFPPLRDRRSDIKEISEKILKAKAKILSEGALEMLMQYDWPGNVRQLKSCLRRACILAKSQIIQPENIRF
ncbi:MAG: sigma 54-interacting transcriptional regulator [Treponema sp.]